MAQNWCLLPQHAEAFLNAIKSGELSPAKLTEMSSAERREAFAKYVGPENAHEVNSNFESKLLLKDQQTGLINFIKKTGGLTEKAKSDFVDKIQKMEKLLTPADERAFLADIAEHKLGVAVTPEQARTIFDLSSAAKAVKEASPNEFAGVSDDYLKASAELKAYIASQKPTTALRSIGMNAKVIARNNLISNPATPIKTSISQFENSLIDALSRRIGLGRVGGANRALATEINNAAWRTYRKTNMNTLAMENLNDTGRLGEGNRFDVQSGADSGPFAAVEAGVRKAAQLSNKVVIDWAHSVPFTKFYQKAFTDMADLFSAKIAAKEGLTGAEMQARAADILRDAARVEPETLEGRMVRSTSQQQAARITNTNSTWASRGALRIKDWLNSEVSGMGDILMPIAKIPANIVANGLENAGGGLAFGARDIFQGRAKIQSLDLATRYEGMAQFAQGIQRFARTTGSLGAAAFFASQLSAADFRQDRYGANFVKIGNIWINLEYISAISPALAGMMMVKAKSNPGEALQDTFGHYIAGAAAPLRDLPGISEINSLVADITRANPGQGGKAAADFAESRLMPAFLSSLLKDRPIERLFFGAHGVESIQEVAHDKYQTAIDHTRADMTVWGQPAGTPDNDETNLQLEKIGYIPKFPMNTINGVRLTPTQYHDYVQIRGRLAKQLLDGAVSSGAWQQLPAHMQVSSAGATVESATGQAQALIMQEDPTIMLRAAQAEQTADAAAAP